MITAVVLIIVLVFMVWPESQIKLELQMRQRLPRLYLLTFRSIRALSPRHEKPFSGPFATEATAVITRPRLFLRFRSRRGLRPAPSWELRLTVIRGEFSGWSLSLFS